MAAFGSIQVGLDVLHTERDEATKTITAQIGDVVAQETDADNAEWWQHAGFCSRPSKVIAGKSACQAVVLRQTDHDVIIATRDVRGQEIAGNLKEGDTCVYASGADGKGQARILLKGDNSLALFSRTDENAKGMGVFIDPASDTIRISNAAGHGITITPAGVFLMTSGAASGLSLLAGGDAKLIATKKCLVDGGSICFGGTATPATPMLLGPTGVAGQPSTKIFGSLG